MTRMKFDPLVSQETLSICVTSSPLHPAIILRSVDSERGAEITESPKTRPN